MEKITFSLEYFDKKTKENEKVIEERFSEEIELIKNLFDIQVNLATKTLWALQIDGITNLNRVLYSTIIKNLFAFYSALDLTGKGLYGSARKLLRYSFEFLMIAKYCSITQKEDLLNRWNQGNEIQLSNDVINKITNPDNNEFKIFWKTMCQFTHATVYSQQIDIEFKNIAKDVSLNYIFLRILLECNYHLLNTHLIKSVSYYVNRYSDVSDIEEISSQKSEIKRLLKKSRNRMTHASKKLVYNYKLEWKIGKSK